MWLAERDACSEVRATIRMSRSSLYTAARRRPEGIPPRREVIGCAVRRRGGAPGRPLHRSAPPGSARSRSRAASARSASGRSSLQISVSGLISGPTAGCRRDDVARARRAVGSRVPIRVVRSWTQRTGRVQWTRGAGGRGPAPQLLVAIGPRRLAGGTAAYRLSLIPAIERKKSTLSHIAPRGEPLSFLRRSVMTSRVRRHPTAPRLVLKCL